MVFKEFSPFLDPDGRVSDTPSSDRTKGTTDNPKLFTGEAAILLKLLGRLTLNHAYFMNQELHSSRVVPGLYRRHSKQFQERYNIPYNRISHDEYNGICFMVAAAPELIQHAKEIVEYGRKHNWQFNDLAPNVDFFDMLEQDPTDVVKKTYQYLKDSQANPDNTNEIDNKYSDISSLASIRQPRDTCFYKIAAGVKPSIIEQLWLSLGIVKSANTKVTEQNRGGTILMAWFRMKALEMLNPPLLISYANKYFDKTLKKRFGWDYPLFLAQKYFHRFPEHPIIKHLKEYLDS